MSDEKFMWDNNVLWHANGRTVAGWVDYSINGQFWYARTAGTVSDPVVRAEFDNKEAARDFLMFIANSESTND
jgi:hypothetical protein